MSADRKLVRAEHNSGVIWKSARWLQMASGAVLFLLTIEAAVAADQSASGESITQSSALVLDGKVKRPQRLSVDALRRLPAERVEVSFRTARGIEKSSYTGVLLWTLLGEAVEKCLRVVMPGDKRGGRYVRDVVEIEVK